MFRRTTLILKATFHSVAIELLWDRQFQEAGVMDVPNR